MGGAFLSDAAMIAVAWGKKGFRGWLLADDGTAIEARETELGLADVPAGGHAETLTTNCGDWLKRHDVPVVLAGMVGARGGWVEAPYAPCPLGPGDLLGRAARPNFPGRGAFILPGAVSTDARGDFDVMRGEELQALGVGALREGKDANLCIPGTHAKLAFLRGGRLTGFRTYVTGELFGLLRNNSLVGALAKGDAFDAASFADGVARGAAEPLAHAVFAARANTLNGKLDPAQVDAYLSGVLIGAELAAHPTADGAETVLLAAGPLAERYGAALAALGRTFVTIDPKEAMVAGFGQLTAVMPQAA